MNNFFILKSNTDISNYTSVLSNYNAKFVASPNISDAKSCDILLLTGGGDPNPCLYGEENTLSSNIDDERDDKELKLIEFFTTQNRAILGICRGLQILNIAFGGTLYQDLKATQTHSRCGLPKDKSHLVKSNKNSILTQLYGENFTVNSAHHQGIKTLAKDFSPLCIANDKTIECICHKSLPIIATQWHPERMYNIPIEQRFELFDFFLKQFNY